MIREHAAAKVNLALHVTGLTDSGYHRLDSLVAFATVGDLVRLEPGANGLRLEGPFADEVPAGPDNLVNRARRAIGEDAGLTVTLVKMLPVAAGLGGGSADAAAVLRAINTERGLGLGRIALERLAGALGADGAMCIACRAARVTGIGADIEPLQAMPSLPCVLVNPRVPLATPAVFGALERKDNAPIGPTPALGPDVAAAARALARLRNDLEIPARSLVPEIGAVLAALRAEPACRLARMSGSGATCFGLFDDEGTAREAARALATDHPEWWVAACRLEDDPFAHSLA